MKIKKGDSIIVVTGKDRGKKGKVDEVFPKLHTLSVAGINVSKRHMKKRDDKNPGGIVDLHLPIAESKVAVICPACGNPTRVGYLVTRGEKQRICRKCEQKI